MRHVRKTAKWTALLVVLATGWAIPAGATTQETRTFVCPVCDDAFDAPVIRSTNNFGGQDRDFLTRARGAQPVLIAPITCPTCAYSGYEDDFRGDVRIPAEVKERIRQGEALTPRMLIATEEERTFIPAWARYDLVAQTYALRGKDYKTLAEQFLSASWAVRLADDTLPALDAPTREALTEWVKAYWNDAAPLYETNASQLEVVVGRAFARKAETAQGRERLMAALAAVTVLRPHGENTEVLRVLRMLRGVMQPEAYAALNLAVSDSVARERAFQARAAALFENAVGTVANKQEKAVATYLCGELHRRLEHWDEARKFLDKCLRLKDCPAWLAEYARQQKARLPAEQE